MLNDEQNCEGMLSLAEVSEDYKSYKIPLTYEGDVVGELEVVTNYTPQNQLKQSCFIKDAHVSNVKNIKELY